MQIKKMIKKIIFKKKNIHSSELKKVQHKNNNLQSIDSKIINNEISSENSLDIDKNSSKSLADFFNGQILDNEQE